MRLRFPRQLLVGATLLTIAGCGAAAATGGAAGTAAPASSAAGAAATVRAVTVSGHGTVLVAGSSGMTLYEFAKDAPGAGTTACTGPCSKEWPALTIAPGTSPATPGLSGQWATLQRPDGSGTQVTYNGMPLYFFSGDKQPGDTNGNYPDWSIATTGSAGGGAAAPSASPTSRY